LACKLSFGLHALHSNFGIISYWESKTKFCIWTRASMSCSFACIKFQLKMEYNGGKYNRKKAIVCVKVMLRIPYITCEFAESCITFIRTCITCKFPRILRIHLDVSFQNTLVSDFYLVANFRHFVKNILKEKYTVANSLFIWKKIAKMDLQLKKFQKIIMVS
jgi:hypothetical protein